MSEQGAQQRGDEPRIDLGKGRPPAGQQPPVAPPPPPAPGWASTPPPPPPGGHAQQGGYPPQGYPPPPGQWQGQLGQLGAGSRLSPADERLWGGAAHWSAFLAMLVAMAFLGPLLVLLVKGNDSPYVRRQAAESLNFQLTILIAGLVSGVLVLVGIGLLLLPLVGLVWLVFTIIGSIKASAGEEYRYPLTLRLVS